MAAAYRLPLEPNQSGENSKNGVLPPRIEATAHTITTKNGHTLAAVLEIPKQAAEKQISGEEKRHVVIIAHGLFSDKNGDKNLWLCNNLAMAGISTFRFDFAGCGESTGDFEQTTYSRRRDDFHAVVDYLTNTLGYQSLGVYGSSMGGAVALMCAAREPQIVRIATLSAVGDVSAIEERYPQQTQHWRNQGYIVENGFRLGIDFVNDAPIHNVVSATRILRAPVFVVHGTEDEIVPVSDSHDIATAAKNSSLMLIDGANHSFDNPRHRRTAMDAISGFLVGGF